MTDRRTARFGEPVTTGFEHVLYGEHLYSGRSEFQKIDVYAHDHFGRVLTLDDLVQTTERDEFCYHEMLVHPVLSCRENVGHVLIIGGGDGGTLRHVLMHDPSRATMCEIDGEVVRVSRELIPSLAQDAFDDARTNLVIGDGAAFVAEHTDAFDAIIVDSTDPIGAATVLFTDEFYAACRRALTPNGVFVTQTGSPMYQGDELRTAITNMASTFRTVCTYLGFVPTYPGVLWSFTAATDGDPFHTVSAERIATRLSDRGITPLFYGPDVHGASFALPPFVRELVAPTKAPSVPRG